MQAKKSLVLAVLVLALLALAFVMTTTGCGSEAVTTTQATTPPTTAAETSTTAAPEPTTTATTASAALASTTTTAFSRPITTELRPGETRLDNGHVRVTGYIDHAEGDGLLAGGGPFHVHVLPAEMLTAEEAKALATGALEIVFDDPRVRGYEMSPTASITVRSLGDGGEQILTLEEFLSIWGANPPAGGEDLVDALWTIDRDEKAVVVSITEQRAQ